MITGTSLFHGRSTTLNQTVNEYCVKIQTQSTSLPFVCLWICFITCIEVLALRSCEICQKKKKGN